MLPHSLKKYLEIFPVDKKDKNYELILNEYKNADFSQAYIDTFLITQEDRNLILKLLGITDMNSFYTYYINGYDDPEMMNEKADLLYSLEEIYEDYKKPFWADKYPNITDRYLQISSIEGESSYFYDKQTDSVYEVDWGEMDDFIAGKLKPIFTSFYDFLEWYYSEEDE